MPLASPDIGRFWSIDPLAEKYNYNSTYAFGENKLGMGIELEGLEVFNTDLAVWYVIKSAEIKAKFRGGAQKVANANDPMKLVTQQADPNFDPERARIKRIGQTAEGLSEMAEATSDVAHFGLEGLGIIDPTGIADGLNAAWYASEGRYIEASLSAIAIIPYIGDAVGKSGKTLNWVIKSDAFEAAVYQIDDFAHFSFKNVDDSVPSLEVFGTMTTEGKHLDMGVDVIPTDVMSGLKTLEESYSQNAGRFSKQMIEYRKAVMEWAKSQGFESIQFSGKRATGPSAGQIQSSRVYDLTN